MLRLVVTVDAPQFTARHFVKDRSSGALCCYAMLDCNLQYIQQRRYYKIFGPEDINMGSLYDVYGTYYFCSTSMIVILIGWAENNNSSRCHLNMVNYHLKR